jgi:hypothetical protein
MATLSGALSHYSAANALDHIAAAAAKAAAHDASGASNQTFPLPAALGSTPFASGGGHDTVIGGHDNASGFDTVVGPAHASFAAPSTAPGSTEAVTATQTAQPAGVTIHFTDGTSLTLAGTSHLTGGFFHH